MAAVHGRSQNRIRNEEPLRRAEIELVDIRMGLELATPCAKLKTVWHAWRWTAIRLMV